MDTIQPSTAQEAADALASCAQLSRRVAIRGGGTKTGWAPVARTPDITLSTLGLNRIVAHRHGDLTATVEAGARLDDVNRELARHNQWIPLDPVWRDRATIGGVVATNDAGPRRHRYGSPRDLIIGVEIARADGIRAKAGGIVVKNVAGYDVARLMTGSFGSLALITSATFKLYPLPATSRTMVAGLQSYAAAGALVAAINASPLTPTAVEFEASPRRMLIRFESTAASVAAQGAAAVRLAESFGAVASLVQGTDEQQIWSAHDQRAWNGSGAVIKVTLLPGDLTAVLSLVDGAAGGTPFEVVGRVGLGVLLVRLDGDVRTQAGVIAALRARVPLDRGSVTVLRGDDALKKDAPIGDAHRVMWAVKRAFDPAGLL